MGLLVGAQKDDARTKMNPQPVTPGGATAGAEEVGDDGPQDARTIAAILKAMGVDSYDERVVNQLLELMYRYIGDVLDDSRTYSEHANKAEVDVEDVKLAIQARASFSFTTPPPREVVLQMSRERNSIPLPSIEARVGIQLPPERYQLTAQNYQVKATSRAADRAKPGHQSSPPAASPTTTVTAPTTPQAASQTLPQPPTFAPLQAAKVVPNSSPTKPPHP